MLLAQKRYLSQFSYAPRKNSPTSPRSPATYPAVTAAYALYSLTDTNGPSR